VLEAGRQSGFERLDDEVLVPRHAELAEKYARRGGYNGRPHVCATRLAIGATIASRSEGRFWLGTTSLGLHRWWRPAGEVRAGTSVE